MARYSFLEVIPTRPATCRHQGCCEPTTARYEAGHAWNDFCTSHADEAEAMLRERTTPQKIAGVEELQARMEARRKAGG